MARRNKEAKTPNKRSFEEIKNTKDLHLERIIKEGEKFWIDRENQTEVFKGKIYDSVIPDFIKLIYLYDRPKTCIDLFKYTLTQDTGYLQGSFLANKSMMIDEEFAKKNYSNWLGWIHTYMTTGLIPWFPEMMRDYQVKMCFLHSEPDKKQ